MKHFFQKQWHYNRQQLFIAITASALVAVFIQSAIGLEYVLRIMPIILTVIVCTAIIFWDAHLKPKLRASSIIVFGSFILEVIGVQTGLLFGNYDYGKLLGFTILSVPIIIGLIWLLVVLSAWHIVMLNTKSLLRRFLLGGLLVVMFDLVLEQFATTYGLWSWQDGSVPLYNYFCWFVLSQLWFFVLYKLTPKAEPSIYIVSLLPLMGCFFWLMLAIA